MTSSCKIYDDLRIVWLRHVWWTREVILAIASSAPWTNESVEKLLENPAEISAIFAPYISHMQRQQMTDLFITHLKLGGDIVSAAKNNDNQKVNQLQAQWHQNASQIAKLMAGFGLCYLEEEVKDMLLVHLELTTNEATLILEGQYKKAIAVFDKVQEEALMMADYFACGILNSKHC